jgi:hypothetical protein
MMRLRCITRSPSVGRQVHRINSRRGKKRSGVRNSLLQVTYNSLENFGAGDGGRTRDVQLGKATVNGKQRTLRSPAPHSGDWEYRVFTLCSVQGTNGAQTEHMPGKPWASHLPNHSAGFWFQRQSCSSPRVVKGELIAGPAPFLLRRLFRQQ